MKLLIVTQAVDKNDPILGFFHRWIEEFAKSFESIIVICLKEGEHTLPKNVRVFSLGKERGEASKVTYSLRFLKFIWKLRNQYDAAFVHMNPEYVLIGGLLWRLWGKRIGLWYTHKSTPWYLRMAIPITHIIFTASKESFRINSNKVAITGHGVDTDFFTPPDEVKRGLRVLSVGRLNKVKRVDLILRGCALIDSPYELVVIGDGDERERLVAMVASLHIDQFVRFVGSLTQEEVRDEYRRASVLVHTSETGSMDKVVLEALLCGCPVVTTSAAYTNLPVRAAPDEPAALAAAITAADGAVVPVQIVRESHSLSRLIAHIHDRFNV